MFDPEGFLKASENIFGLISNEGDCKEDILNGNCVEALYRTIVSRAYYSVYLSCREVLRRKWGVNVDSEAKKRKISSHVLLPEIISRRLGKQYLRDWINDLRLSRLNSDYQLNIVCNRGDAEKSLTLAKNVFKEMEEHIS